MEAIVEHQVRSRQGGLLFAYYDITDLGRGYQRRLSETLSSFSELVEEVQRALRAGEGGDASWK